MKERTALFPGRVCETFSGDLAYTVGRLAFKPGRPMLVEHVNGLYLEHDLSGCVLTMGYGPEYNIAHVWEEEGAPAGSPARTSANDARKVFAQGRSGYRQSLR